MDAARINPGDRGQCAASPTSTELRYDSTLAPGAKKEDVRYLLGVGWQT
jgi:hypothetical protein